MKKIITSCIVVCLVGHLYGAPQATNVKKQIERLGKKDLSIKQNQENLQLAQKVLRHVEPLLGKQHPWTNRNRYRSQEQNDFSKEKIQALSNILTEVLKAKQNDLVLAVFADAVKDDCVRQAAYKAINRKGRYKVNELPLLTSFYLYILSTPPFEDRYSVTSGRSYNPGDKLRWRLAITIKIITKLKDPGMLANNSQERVFMWKNPFYWLQQTLKKLAKNGSSPEVKENAKKSLVLMKQWQYDLILSRFSKIMKNASIQKAVHRAIIEEGNLEQSDLKHLVSFYLFTFENSTPGIQFPSENDMQFEWSVRWKIAMGIKQIIKTDRSKSSMEAEELQKIRKNPYHWLQQTLEKTVKKQTLQSPVQESLQLVKKYKGFIPDKKTSP